MLVARDLTITWGDTPCYWRWNSIRDSRFPEGEEVLDVCWFKSIGGSVVASFLQ
ncbi:hypothetical protein SLEP1_g14945 [Rubroshorea leprosula]|uniref:Uncharacterized protein n=1 Tax=Rubroshorea leprosula TaxID=152421 RepID=A0AAV5IKT0_9ROSI|nr:hypothetical protein SLEP1_g14945 [Rubroshorea leprosula]